MSEPGIRSACRAATLCLRREMFDFRTMPYCSPKSRRSPVPARGAVADRIDQRRLARAGRANTPARMPRTDSRPIVQRRNLEISMPRLATIGRGSLSMIFAVVPDS